MPAGEAGLGLLGREHRRREVLGHLGVARRVGGERGEELGLEVGAGEAGGRVVGLQLRAPVIGLGPSYGQGGCAYGAPNSCGTGV